MSTRKGKKPVKNVPLLHEELKSRHCVWLTPTAWDKLQKKATNNGISISELLENIATEIEF